MFTKQLKYDMIFCKKVFFAMAGIVFALAVIMRFTISIFGLENSDVATGMVVLASVIGIGITVAVLASIFQIFDFFRKSFFGDSGYLTLTLPVTRNSLLLSKIAVAQIWFNFMLITTSISLLLLSSSTIVSMTVGETLLQSLRDLIRIEVLIVWMEANIMVFFFIAIMFFCVTLSNSVFRNIRIHGLVSGIFGVGVISVFFWLFGRLSQRSHEFYEHIIQTDRFMQVSSSQTPLIGLRYGRISVGEVIVDLYRLGMTLAFAVLAILVTHYLLQKRVSLR